MGEISRKSSSGKDEPRPRGCLGTVVIRFFYFIGQIIWLILLGAIAFGGMGVAGYCLLERELSGGDIEVPNVCGVRMAEALTLLLDKKVDLSIQLEGSDFSELAEPDAILTQTPAAGKFVKAGTVVRVRVSKGGDSVVCPDLRGYNHLDAGILLRQMKLAEGKKSYVSDPQIERDKIISQDPPGGSVIERQSAVNLLISTGPSTPAVVMPNLVGQSVPEAEDALRQIGLGMGKVSQEPKEDAIEGAILRQKPAAGERVTANTPIEVTIANNLGENN
jgi:beta-lactam-binding protein with PASTA domain